MFNSCLIFCLKFSIPINYPVQKVALEETKTCKHKLKDPLFESHSSFQGNPKLLDLCIYRVSKWYEMLVWLKKSTVGPFSKKCRFHGKMITIVLNFFSQIYHLELPKSSHNAFGTIYEALEK